MKLAVLVVIVLTCALTAGIGADTVDRDWTFDAAGNTRGWSANSYFDPTGVAAGYWWGETSAAGSYVTGPDDLALAAQSSHYLSIKMRLRKTGAPDDYYAKQTATVRWITASDTTWNDTKSLQFTAWGNAAWHVFTVHVGGSSYWSGTVRQLRFDPAADLAGKRVEVAWIRVMRDTTPPEFSIKNTWSYDDDEQTGDTTPTIVLRNCSDNASGLGKAEFYMRAHGSGSWILAGADAVGSDGYSFTYSGFANGSSYDLAVRLYDQANNSNSAGDVSDHWASNLAVNTSAGTTVKVTPSRILSPFNKMLTGTNPDGWQWCGFYDMATNSVPSVIESRAREIKMAAFRYPFGCHASTYYWKRTIGPPASRSPWYINSCGQGWIGTIPYATIFGLDEYCRWCEKMGVNQYLVMRFRWKGCPSWPVYDEADAYTQALNDAADCVEYCNSPNNGSNPNGGTDWAAVRAANGHPAPYNVKYWEIGNEPSANDPYGSLNDPEVYSINTIKFANAMKAVDPTVICSAGGGLSPRNTSSTWENTMYAMVGPYVGAFHPHCTAPKSAQTDMEKLYWELMSVSRHLDDCLENRRGLIRDWSDGRLGQVKLSSSEWFIGGNTVDETALKSAGLTIADYLITMAENYDVFGTSEYSSFYPGDETSMVKNSNGDVGISYYPFYMIANRCFDSVIKCRVISPPRFDYDGSGRAPAQTDLAMIRAFSTRSTDGRVISLCVINKDKTNARTALVDLTGYVSAGTVDVDKWELNASSVDSNVPIVTTGSAVYASSFSYSFPAHSVTSFIIRPTARQKASISEVKDLPDQTRVQVSGLKVSAIYGGGVFYVTDPDRKTGIKVIPDAPVGLALGDDVTVTGTLILDAGERQLLADSVTKA